MGLTLTSAIQFCPIKLSTVTYMHTYIHLYTYTHTFIQIIHTYMHTYIHTYIHTYMHMRAHVHAYTLSYTYIHTKNHVHVIASTTLSLDSTKFPEKNKNKKTKQQNGIPSVSNPKISPSIHFKSQIPQTVSLQIHISFSPASSQVLPLQHCIYLFTCVLHSNNDSKHQLHLPFYLCLALQQ